MCIGVLHSAIGLQLRSEVTAGVVDDELRNVQAEINPAVPLDGRGGSG